MKSSQMMARIEAAGWTRIRSVGSHFTYEHPKYGKVLYAYGRPHTDIGKRNVRELEAKFKLKEIAKAKEDARAMTVSATAPAQVTAWSNGSEMTDELARLFFAQLHHDHKISITQISKVLGINFSGLTAYFHRGEALKSSDRHALFAWLLEQEKRLDLTRDRKELRIRGYGARVGTTNSSDPWLENARDALLEALEKVHYRTDLAKGIGIHVSVVDNIINRKVKSIYPTNKHKIQQWMTENEFGPKPDPTITTVTVEPKPVVEAPTKPQEAPQPAARPVGLDPELEAIMAILKALSGLDRETSHRALAYVTARIQ